MSVLDLTVRIHQCTAGLFVVDQRLVLDWQGLAQSTKAGATLLDRGNRAQQRGKNG